MELEKDKQTYTACYCEENIWKLCEQIRSANDCTAIDSCWVVFISNKERCISLWKQQKADHPDAAVFWDYHVVLIFAPALMSTAKVFDFDSVLEFPCSLDVYLRAALRPNSDWKLRTFLRLIPAEEFLNQFASDRSHMWNEKLRKYSSPPPSYPCIGSENCENNIEDFINMTNEERGLVIELEYFAWKLENSRTALFSDSMKSLEKSKTENRKCSNQFPSS